MIFIDRCISEHVATALKAIRDDIIWHDDLFSRHTLDSEWLLETGARGYLVITRDKKIRTRRHELRAIIDGRVGCFIL